MAKEVKSKLFNDAFELYNHMLRDISKAKKLVFLEAYIYDGDAIGTKFRDVLIKKAKSGVTVKLLIDAWGSSVSESFFSELVAAGGEVRFFRKFRFKFRFFEHNHRRNHRKLLLIDNKIVYVGSANITDDCLNWRELTIRMVGEIAKIFNPIFEDTYGKYQSNILEINKKETPIRYGEFTVLGDYPSFITQNIKFKYIQIINSARKSIYIETPYFVPDMHLRKVLKKAAKRGVQVNLILPYISDVRLVDILRDAYLGRLFKNNIRIFFYTPKVMHSKAMLVDDSTFIIGTANLDYRSFMHQYELCVYGGDKSVIKQLKEHITETMYESEVFDYDKWAKRPILRKILERILSLFKQWI